MASSYLRTPSSPLQATLSRVWSFDTHACTSRTGGGSGVTKEEVAFCHCSSVCGVVIEQSLSSSCTKLDLLDQLASSTSDLEGYESESNPDGPTLRKQLARLVSDREGNFSIPLGKNLKKVSEKFHAVSQKRNIKRQAYMAEVSQRNDSVFFTTIGAFVILPPFVILGIAVLTGYVQFFP